jgi:pseudoazurin
MSHNSASVDGMIPAGANSWNGTINQDISITLDQEGVYVYQCTPHAMMAMVGVIQVGEAVNMDDVISAADTKKSGFVSNTDRLDEYLSRL